MGGLAVHPEAPALFAHLAYRNVPAAMAWLSQCFGFEQAALHVRPDGFVQHAEMRLGRAILMMMSELPDQGWRSPLSLPGTSQYVHVYLEDIDAHYQRAKDAGAKVARELGPTEYGTRAYAAVDLEGHYWWFDTYHPHG